VDACSLVFLLCGADGYCSITVAKYGLGRLSSRDLQPIRAKKFINKFYLILHACVLESKSLYNILDALHCFS